MHAGARLERPSQQGCRARYPDAIPISILSCDRASERSGLQNRCAGCDSLTGLHGLQALQRCSGLLNRKARGSTVATHHAFMQKSAGFPCSEALPERYRLKAPISDRELGQFEQPAFNRLGRAQVPGGPPFFVPGLNNRSSAAFEAACVGASPAPGASCRK